MTYGLAVTVHDPEERWLRRLSPGLDKLLPLYAGAAASCSSATSARTLEALAALGVHVVTSPSDHVGQGRRHAVCAVLEDTRAEWIQYADLDRLLHWQYAYPDELRETLQQPPGAEYVALGRTERALATHPRVQVLAETLTNAAYSAAFGRTEIVDEVAGSCLLSRRAAEVILALSIERSNATDLEWPCLVFRELGVAPEYRFLEGLEFETADYYAAEIQRAGSLEAWMQRVYDLPEMWAQRTRLALKSIEAMRRVLSSEAQLPRA